tara:strand:+ start:355 stop:567 length:213 start_codon:yes stop_codon:yes gene_type:complete
VAWQSGGGGDGDGGIGFERRACVEGGKERGDVKSEAAEREAKEIRRCVMIQGNRGKGGRERRERNSGVEV